jgi:putative FmdB family regulatory protein
VKPVPTYEYRCEACLKEIEEFQSITAPALSECPFCKSHQLKRKIGGGQTLLRFQGKGFYLTDYAKSSAQSATEGATKDSSDQTDSRTSQGGCCPCGKKESCSSEA